MRNRSANNQWRKEEANHRGFVSWKYLHTTIEISIRKLILICRVNGIFVLREKDGEKDSWKGQIERVILCDDPSINVCMKYD